MRLQLILALYGSGRRAEAIQAYNGARTLLVSEYGIDPDAGSLFHQVLRDDQHWSPPVRADRPRSGRARAAQPTAPNAVSGRRGTRADPVAQCERDAARGQVAVQPR